MPLLPAAPVVVPLLPAAPVVVPLLPAAPVVVVVVVLPSVGARPTAVKPHLA